jgi:S-DNA-T family DNA segregation ATPase FtsK/SpoIIIE
VSLLERDKGKPETGDIKANANIIKRTLQNFGILVEMDEVSIGPTVTRFALKPAEGVRLQKIVSLQNNLELALAAAPVRIEAPIPGKSLVGIEVPNQKKAMVGLASLVGDDKFVNEKRPLYFALGRDIGGQVQYANLAKMPHLLIAGATGSGKSVSIHAIIASLLYRNGPAAMRFIMIDPKRVELTLYNPIPHLLTPVITDPKKAILSLKWAAKEMERRYNILESHAVRDISSYHENVVAKWTADSGDVSPDQMPYIIIVIDEIADIMQTYPRELEAAIVRLAQMSRAVGIHLILSTQRPSVNVITGLIKANVPARIALQVASQIDSRTILDGPGAENLLGAGDMLFQSADMPKPQRIQTAFISEQEVKEIAAYIKKHNEPALDDIAITSASNDIGPNAIFGAVVGEDDVDDDMYDEAKRTVEEAGRASTSLLQRKLRVGYSRAARLMDILESKGIIGPQDGAKPREILSVGGAAPQHTEDDV